MIQNLINSNYLIKGGNVDTETDTYIGRIPSEDRGRNQGDTGQGTPDTDSKPAEAGREAWDRLPFTVFR